MSERAEVDQEAPVVEVRGVSRAFGQTVALDNVSLAVPRGVVYGLIGENGAGKTTLIKHVLGLLRPKSGSVRVFGRDPIAEPVEVLSRIGTLTEERDLPGWMRVEEAIAYTRAFYPKWDDAYADSLRRAFELNPKARVRELSRGQQARMGIVLALAYRPDLLVLDEPSSGLDPVVRRDILGAIIRTITDDGRTVLFSSHLLDEVERVSDCVAMIDRGRVVFSGPLDRIKSEHRRFTLRFDDPRDRPASLEGLLASEGDRDEWSGVRRVDADQAVEYPGRVIEDRSASLDEIFVAHRLSGRQALAEVES